MKKIALIGTLMVFAGSAAAEEHFTGWYAGAELNSTKHTLTQHDLPNDWSANGGSNKTGLGVFGGYGFDFAQDFVGTVEAKFKTSGATTNVNYMYGNNYNYTKEKYTLGISYLQGYRINNFMPYIKVGGEISIVDLNNQQLPILNDEKVGLFGVTYGVGLRYAATKNIEVGAEFAQTHLRHATDETRIKANTTSLNVAYRF